MKASMKAGRCIIYEDMPDNEPSPAPSGSRKPPTEKQIAARKAFAERVRAAWAARKPTGGSATASGSATVGSSQPSAHTPPARVARVREPGGGAKDAVPDEPAPKAKSHSYPQDRGRARTSPTVARPRGVMGILSGRKP